MIKFNWFIGAAGILYLFGAVMEFKVGNYAKSGVWVCYAGANFLLMAV